MSLDALMDEFAKEAGLKPFVANGNGVFNIEIDSIPVSLGESGDGHIVLQGPVGEPPPAALAGRERLYRVLLESMFHGEGTGGATLSIERASGMVFLHKVENGLALDYVGFKAFLESFVTTLGQWRRILVDFRSVAERMERDGQEGGEASRDAILGGDGFIRV